MLVDRNQSFKISFIKFTIILIILECFRVTYLAGYLMNSEMMMCGNFCVCCARSQIQDLLLVSYSYSLKIVIFNI